MFIYKQRTFSRIIIFSIILTILSGTILLSLPIAQKSYISVVDCLFTATSCVSVTGTLTISFDYFTVFGKIVIMLLTQIGGVSLVTLSLFLLSTFSSKFTITTKAMAGQMFDLESLKNIGQMLTFIVLFTLGLELVGALIIYFIIHKDYTVAQAIFNSIFHSISSFCSAGFSVFPNSLIHFQNNIPMLLTTASLILGGTLGFITWYELFFYIKNKLQKKRAYISLTTKVILSVTITLVLIATLLLTFLEGNNSFNDKSIFTALYNMFFNAIYYRSTGFTSINLDNVKMATLFLILIYGFIGSAPGSTGGGIKTTTFAIFIATIRSVIHARTSVELKLRKIPQDEIFKALAILSLSFSWIIFITFLLLLSEADKLFSDLFFETLSTFATLGISTGISSQLSNWGKLLIVSNMIIGRIGTLTILLAIKRKSDKTEFQYPEERITIS